MFVISLGYNKTRKVLTATLKHYDPQGAFPISKMEADMCCSIK